MCRPRSGASCDREEEGRRACIISRREKSDDRKLSDCINTLRLGLGE
jgi:hypothetical protein